MLKLTHEVIWVTIGQRIKNARIEKKLTQEDVAKRVGVAIQTIYKYENGIVTNIPSDKIENIAKALETTPAYLMGWEPEPSSKENKSPSNLDSFLAKKKVIADIKNSTANTYTIHGSQGKGSVVKSSIPKDNGILAFNEKTYELTQAEFTALESVIKAMRTDNKN